jgi:hypothetical protein
VLQRSSLPEVFPHQDIAGISPHHQNNYGLDTYKLKYRQQMNIKAFLLPWKRMVVHRLSYLLISWLSAYLIALRGLRSQWTWALQIIMKAETAPRKSIQKI